MADSTFSHLINIVYQSIGVKQAQEDASAVQSSLNITPSTTYVQYVDSINKAFSKTGEESKKAGVGIGAASQKMGDFEKALRRAAIVAPVWMALRFVLQSVFSLIQSQMKFLVDLEDAMARMQIVGKGTAEQYNNLKFSLIGLAYAYGTAAAESLKAAVIFAQQGKTVAETLVLTRVAMMGAQVLGKDVTTMTEDLTAAMNAFNIPAGNAVSIIDKFINVEKNFAVTSKDLADGVKAVGATANQVGISLAALTGDITAVIEVTRKSGSEAARGLQFIYARLLTSGKPVIEQLTGIKFYLDAAGNSTSALTGTLRSATEILDELASKWAGLTNEEQLNVAAALGSKRQLVVLNSLMQNYTHSIDARIKALTSAGEAERALNILQDTASYKAKQLTSAWNGLTASLADTSAWKGVLDFLGKSITGWAMLLNYEKGYKVFLSQQIATQLADIDTRQNQISSIEELIKIRNKLMTEIPSDKNTERLNIINTAIEKITSEHPSIKFAIEKGNPEELRKGIQNISDELTKKKIVAQVNLEFLPQIQNLDKRKAELQKTIKEFEDVGLGRSVKPQKTTLIEIEKQRKLLLKQQSEEIQKQFALSKAQNLQQTIDDEEEISRLMGTLTDKELEQLDTERQLHNFRMLDNTTLEQQIQKEMELVSTSKSIYDIHDKNIKLAQLENQLLDAKLQKRDEEINKLATIAMQYEKADMFEKTRIRRAAELSTLPASQLAGVYRGSEFDKNVILDYWSTFSDEAQRAVTEVMPLFAGLKYSLPNIEIPNLENNRLAITTPTPIPPVMNYEAFGAKFIEVVINGEKLTPEEIARIVGIQLEENADFRAGCQEILLGKEKR